MEIRSPQTQSEWDDYFDLRYRLLRAPLKQPLGSERNEGDVTGVHFALFEDQNIKAIARLDQASEGVSQVRFVAVDKNLQGKGYGRMIMEATEQHSIKEGNHKMILHARDYALDFYLRLGYTNIEKSYKLFDVLQHYLMEKKY